MNKKNLESMQQSSLKKLREYYKILFGEMRQSTPEEQQSYRNMLYKNSVPIEGVNIFKMNMNEIEIDYCDICHKKTQVFRKYYYYDIDCECCGKKHFEIIRYCKDCKPEPPKYTTVILHPIEEYPCND